jgi:hypothetical protein
MEQQVQQRQSRLESQSLQVVMIAHRSLDLRSIATGGENGVAGSQGGLGGVNV